MTPKQLVVGKKYHIEIPEHKVKRYKGYETVQAYSVDLHFLEQVEGYDHKCECCGKDTMNGFIFCSEYYGDVEPTYSQSWESGVYFIGGSACLRKYVAEIV